MSRRLRTPLLTTCVAVTVALGSTFAQQKPSHKKTEAEIKSGLVVNFCRYMLWSELPDPPAAFDIHIVGDDPLGAAIDELYEERKVADRSVEIRRFGCWAELPAARRHRIVDCQLLIIAETDPKVVAEIVGLVGKRQVVTVGFIPKFLHIGGDVEVFVQANRVRFDVAHDHLKAKGVKVSSKLLKYAVVNPASGPLPTPAEDDER